MRFVVLLVIGFLVASVAWFGIEKTRTDSFLQPVPAISTSTTQTSLTTDVPATRTSDTPTSTSSTGSPTTSSIHQPISNAQSRITKKPFGIFVTPQNSPVSPERFTGYHTGVDFETTPAEQKTDVPIYAMCTGMLRMKKFATGYGGVAVQNCKIDGKDVTIVYGHLRLTSIAPKVGSTMEAGQKIGVLGTGFSKETDGERKHLHLGIHIGTTINIAGYVSNKKLLSQWMDGRTVLEKK